MLSDSEDFANFHKKWFQNLRSGSRARRRPIEKAQSATHSGGLAFIGGVQHSHWASDGVLKPRLKAVTGNGDAAVDRLSQNGTIHRFYRSCVMQDCAFNYYLMPET
jgi:hypothetical protein